MNQQDNNNKQKSIEDENWYKSHWRPMIAFSYIAIILFDFIVGPVFWSIVQIVGEGSVETPWVPLTLISGGIFHAAIGAILGVAAFTRGQEKIERVRRDFDRGGSDDRDGRRNDISDEQNG